MRYLYDIMDIPRELDNLHACMRHQPFISYWKESYIFFLKFKSERETDFLHTCVTPLLYYNALNTSY